MANTIKIRRSAVQGAVPTTAQLALGELAINHYDGKLYAKKSVGGTESIVELSAGTGGVTVTVASSVADILSANSGELSADDAGADRLVFWDDSAGKLTYLDLGANLTITGTTISATGGGGGVDAIETMLFA